MKAGTIKVSDELLCRALGLDDKTAIVGITRCEDYVSTYITIVHPKLPNLIEGSYPPPIQIEDIHGEPPPATPELYYSA